MVPTIYENGVRHQLFVIRSDGKTAIRFAYVRTKAPFNSDTVMHELLRRVNEVPGLSFGPESLGKKPVFALELLASPLALEKFRSVVEWMIGQIRSGQPAAKR
jgi:hypothetical protein